MKKHKMTTKSIAFRIQLLCLIGIVFSLDPLTTSPRDLEEQTQAESNSINLSVNSRRLEEEEEETTDDADNQIVEGADQPDTDDDTPAAKTEAVAAAPTGVANKQRTKSNVGGGYGKSMTEYEIADLQARYKRGEYQLTIQSIQPNGGPISGGTRVLVRTESIAPFVDIYPHPKCKFGTNDRIVDALYVKCLTHDMGFFEDEGAKKDGVCVQCESSPLIPEWEIVSFTMSLTGNFDDATSSMPFRYYTDPIVTDVYPRSGPKSGDTVFKIKGENFMDSGDDFRCNFGPVSTKAHLKSDTQIWCSNPSSDIVGRGMPFSVTLNRQQSTRQNIKMYYYNMQTIYKIDPNYGNTMRDSNITIYGNNFWPWDPEVDHDFRKDAWCAFGVYGKRKATIINSNTAECVAPANSQKLENVPVKLTLNNQNYTDDEFHFEFFDPPNIIELDPQNGPEDGGMVVKFYGTNFETHKNITCMFDKMNTTGKFVNKNQIDCTVPNLQKTGAVKVRIAYQGERIASDPLIFHSVGTPNKYNMTMIDSSSNQTKVAKIIGQEMNNTSSDIAQKRKEALAIMKGDVNGTTDEGSKAIEDLDAYMAAQVTDLKKNAVDIGAANFGCGPVQGYTQFIIMGQNFHEYRFGDAKCIFNHSISMNATVLDSNTLVCNSPPFDQSQQDFWYQISMTLDGHYVANSTNKFKYYIQPQIFSVSPGLGPMVGGTDIVITGKGFSQKNLCNPKVRMEQQLLPFNIVNDTTILIKSPAVNESGATVIGFTGNDQNYINDIILHYRDTENTFEYYQQFEIQTISPDLITNEGGTAVELRALNFDQFKFDNRTHKNVPIYCRYVQDNADATLLGKAHVMIMLSQTEQQCDSPATDYVGNARIELSVNQQQWHAIQGRTVRFYNGPKVTQVSPKSGVTKNPNKMNLTISGENLECPNGDCSRIKVRFTNDKGDQIFVDGEKDGSNIKCKIPTYPSPETLYVDISINGVTYTNSKVSYGFNDPYILKIKPTIISANGKTTVKLHGYGFVKNEAGQNMVRFEAEKGNLTCAQDIPAEVTPQPIAPSEEGSEEAAATPAPTPTPAEPTNFGPCKAEYKVIDEHTATVELFQQKYARLDGKPFNDEYFYINLLDLDGKFNKNGIKMWYYKDIAYSGMSATFAYANEEKPVMVDADFQWGKQNEYSIFKNSANITCRFTGNTDPVQQVVFKGLMDSSPLGEYSPTNLPNQIRCRTPKWNRTETITLDLSVNGVDYVGNFKIPIVEPLTAVKISPLAGPINGGTKIKLYGSGYDASIPAEKEVYVRFGALESVLLDKANVQSAEQWHKDSYYDKELQLTPNMVYQAEMNDKVLAEGDNIKSYFAALSPDMRRLYNNDPYSVDGQGGPVYVQLSERIPTTIKRHDATGAIVNDYIETTYSDSSSMEYYFYRNPFVTKIEPNIGLTEGDTQISVSGGWFQQIPEYGVYPFCKINEIVTRGQFITTNRIICPSPPSTDTTKLFKLSVSLNGVDWVETAFTFSYFEKPILDDIQPRSGVAEGGTEINLKGSKFSNSPSMKTVRCRFRQMINGQVDDEHGASKYVPATYVSAEKMKCGSPSGWQGGQSVKVDLTFNGVDFTDSSFNFDLYSIFGNFPKSGPADASGQTIQIKGKGFRNAFTIMCGLGTTEVPPVKVKASVISCPMVLPDWPSDKYTSIPFYIVIDGMKHDFGQFHYYKQVVVDAVNPILGPNEGSAHVYISGRNFRADFENAKPNCRIGNSIAQATILDTETVRCTVNKKLPLVDEGQSLLVSFSLNSYSWAQTDDSFFPYGIISVFPTSGPLKENTNIQVVGKGFNNEFIENARCKFGTDENYQIVQAQVLSNENLVCKSPSIDLELPAGTSQEISVPFSIAFQDDIYFPYTAGSHKFRFYNHPLTTDIDPQESPVDKLTEVYITADKSQGFPQPIPSPGTNRIDTQDFGIKCKFGRFGVSSATYVNSTTILCLTPNVLEDPNDIGEENVLVSVAMNGIDFNDDETQISFTFVGKGGNISVWVIIMMTMVLSLLIISIWFFVSGLQQYWNNKNKERQPNVILDHYGLPHERILSRAGGGSGSNQVSQVLDARARISAMQSRAQMSRASRAVSDNRFQQQ